MDQMIYKLDNNVNKIKVFGTEFVENNLGKCEIIINKEKKKLNEYYEYVYNNKETILLI